MKFVSMTWVRTAQDRSKWYQLGATFALQWADNDDEDWLMMWLGSICLNFPLNTNKGEQALTGESRHQQGRTGTNRGEQAPTGENRHQQERAGTNRGGQAPTKKSKHQQRRAGTDGGEQAPTGKS